MSGHIHLSTTNPELALRQLKQLIPLFRQQNIDYAMHMFPNKEKSDELYHRIVQWSGLAAAHRADEAGGVNWQTGRTPYKKDFFPKIYQIGVKYSRQARTMDVHGVYKRFGKEMARALYKARQNYGADQGFNNATSTATEYVGIDGVAKTSASHPTATTTWSNLATSGVLSQSTFDDTYQQLWAAREYMDDPYTPVGKFKMLYSRSLVAKARKLLETDRVVGSLQNDKNVIRDYIIDPGPNPFFTNLTQFAFVAADAENNPGFEVQVADYPLIEDFDINVPCYKLLAEEQYLFGTASAYNTVFNAGT